MGLGCVKTPTVAERIERCRIRKPSIFYRSAMLRFHTPSSPGEILATMLSALPPTTDIRRASRHSAHNDGSRTVGAEPSRTLGDHLDARPSLLAFTLGKLTRMA